METGHGSSPKAGGDLRSPKELERESGVSPKHAPTLRETPPAAPAGPPSCPSPPLGEPQRADPGALPLEGVTAYPAMETEAGADWTGLGGVVPVLPPSPPPEDGEPARVKPSSSDDSTSSASSSSSSASSSSRDRSCFVPAIFGGDSRSLHSGGSLHVPLSPPRRRRGLQQEEEGEVSHRKKPCPERGAGNENEMKRHQTREVKQAGTGSVMEVEACSEMQDPAGASVGNSEEITTTRACSAHKISLTTSKPAQGCELVVVGPLDPGAPTAGTSGEAESGGSASRKRRWGSSTTATAKQQQPTISTDSLKSVIPDVKPAVGLGNQEVVVELHPEEGHLSEDEERGRTGELKVQRTVTQVVSVKKQENGQKEGLEEEEEEEAQGGGDGQRVLKEERKDCSVVVTMEMQTPPTPEADAKKVLPNKTLVHRSVSQQKSGVSVTIDDPVCSAQLPSSPRGKITNIIHICNLVRPFTLGQLKELLSRTGTVVEDGFCIDKIKSNCYVTYPSVEEAAATRTALHGVKWPQSNPKFLRVGFCEQDEVGVIW
ncbi:hypothetical protein SKAU_G00288810 [Synaphobranchus kaupii]|uniref:Apoptotic chromatin condensation inducer 1 n=1 Tax=Synaphobranchus kaupii TaxID=118154 RepID=A0A9Q1ETE4_SYNKA|nr:hypothetical protein SKAU_G00288810 [Synaphobranchus kaupii]